MRRSHLVLAFACTCLPACVVGEPSGDTSAPEALVASTSGYYAINCSGTGTYWWADNTSTTYRALVSANVSRVGGSYDASVWECGSSLPAAWNVQGSAALTIIVPPTSTEFVGTHQYSYSVSGLVVPPVPNTSLPCSDFQYNIYTSDHYSFELLERTGSNNDLYIGGSEINNSSCSISWVEPATTASSTTAQ